VNAAREPQTRPNAGGLSGRASRQGVDPLRPHGRRARFEITLALDRTPATSRPRPPFVNSAARRQRGIHLRYERDRREIWRIATQRAPAAAPPAPWAAGSTRATTPTTARRAAREAGIAAGDPPQMSFLQPRRTVHGRRARKAPDSRAESIPPSTVPEQLPHVPRIAATHELKLPKLRDAHLNSFAGSGSNQTRVALPLRPRMYRMSIPTASNTMTRPRRDQSSASGTGGEQSTTARMTQSPVTPSRQASAQPSGIVSAAFKPAWQPSPSHTTLASNGEPLWPFKNCSARTIDCPTTTGIFIGTRFVGGSR